MSLNISSYLTGKASNTSGKAYTSSMFATAPQNNSLGVNNTGNSSTSPLIYVAVVVVLIVIGVYIKNKVSPSTDKSKSIIPESVRANAGLIGVIIACIGLAVFMFKSDTPLSFGKVFSTANAVNSQNGNSLLRIGAYIFSVLIIILILLLFIHFFITPIFSLYPGTPGIISLPGFDDGSVFWNKETAAQILNEKLPISTQCFNYSLNLDVFIQNPIQFSEYPRIIFSRGASERNNPPTGNTLLGLVNNYNLIIALLPDTTDMIVSVLNKDNNPENVIIPNIPAQEPFRLGIVLMEKAMEVYMNGKLIRTRAFDASPKAVLGNINIAKNDEINIAKLRNLKIWNRILLSSEIRNATPELSNASDFGATAIPVSSSCA